MIVDTLHKPRYTRAYDCRIIPHPGLLPTGEEGKWRVPNGFHL
jgi:hypothetical protein